MSRDYGIEAQQAAEAHLEQCFAAEFDEDVEDPSCAPFCGCTTCIVREVLFIAFPIAFEAFKDPEVVIE